MYMLIKLTSCVFNLNRSFTSGIKKIIRKHSDCIYACSETLQVSERRIALDRILRSKI